MQHIADNRQVTTIGAIGAALTSLFIVLFDLTAGLGAAGIGVGMLPVAAAFAIAPSYIVLLAALHQLQHPSDRVWTLMALGFGILYAAIVSFNYALQLTVVPSNPELFSGWTLELKPDSAFWALEVAGYTYMGLSALCLIPTLRGTRAGRIASLLLIVNAVCTGIGLVAYLATRDPGHWLAVASLIVWGVTFPVATLLIGRQLRPLA